MDALWALASGARRERKFPLPGRSAAEARALIMLHPACFRPCFPERTVNSLYLDGLGLPSARAGLEGELRRRKTRIRWYGEPRGEAADPRLELKLKRGFLGAKVVRALPPFVAGPAFTTERARALLGAADLEAALRLAVGGMRLAAEVSFRRAYFLSADGRFHATLDWAVRGAPLDGRLGLFPPPSAGPSPLIELKYEPAYDEEAAAVRAWFPARSTASSKYLGALGAPRGRGRSVALGELS